MDAARLEPKRRTRHLVRGAVAALLVLAADQLSKWFVLKVLDLETVHEIKTALPVLSLSMVWNKGVTFGLFNAGSGWGSWVLVGVAAAVVTLLLVWLFMADSKLAATALGAITGGAVGNIADRVRFGAVVDFLHAHAWGHSWYVFNVADAAIVCGVAALLLDGIRPADPLADIRRKGV